MEILAVLFVAILVILVLFVSIYNGLIRKRVECENAWSQIEVQLKRRHDLIPNLVETVKGYASHEKDTLEKVIKARSNAVSSSQTHDATQQIQAENMLTGALRQLFAVVESYPDLKANQNFLQLQEEVGSTENRIGFARQHYNDTVAIYNSSIQQIPGNLVAGMGGFKEFQFFDLTDEEEKAVQTPPKVSF